MNKIFFKKNILLIVILFVTVLASVYLLFMISSEYTKMQQYIEETAAMVDKVNKLNAQKPAPVEENFIYMKKDIDGYKEKINDLRTYLGRPYYDAAIAFVKELLAGSKNDAGEELTDDEKLERFKLAIRSYWEANQSTVARDQVYISFKLKSKELLGVDFKDYNARWEKGLEKFMNEAKKQSGEKMEENIQDVFMFTFGFRRTMSFQVGKYENFAKLQRYRLIDYYSQNKVAFGTQGASTFGFPPDEKIDRTSIPQYVFCWEIVSDLAKRIADAKVLQLHEFTKRGVEPVSEGNYKYYRFTFKVEGTLESIRNLANILYSAYDKRRVYVIRNITLSLIEDTLKTSLEQEDAAKIPDVVTTTTNEHSNMPHGGALGMAPNKPTLAAPIGVIPEKQENLPYYERKDYGKVIFGGQHSLCMATFTVDYVVYSSEDMR